MFAVQLQKCSGEGVRASMPVCGMKSRIVNLHVLVQIFLIVRFSEVSILYTNFSGTYYQGKRLYTVLNIKNIFSLKIIGYMICDIHTHAPTHACTHAHTHTHTHTNTHNTTQHTHTTYTHTQHTHIHNIHTQHAHTTHTHTHTQHTHTQHAHTTHTYKATFYTVYSILAAHVRVLSV